MSKWFTKRNFIILLSVIFIILIFLYIIPVSLPIIFALLTALLIDPLVRLVEKQFKWNRKPAVISVFIFILAIISSLLYYTVTRLIGKIIDFTHAAPGHFNTLSGFWIDMQNKLFQYTAGMPTEVIESIQESFKNIFDSIRIAILELLSYDKITSLLTDVPNFLVSLIVFIIALFLFMLELPELKKLLFKYLTKSTEKKVRFMVTKLNSILFGFVKAQFLVSLIIFAVTLVGLLLIKPKYAIIMSVIIWIIDLIPILGSIIILAPWALYYFISGDVGTGTQLTILAIILLVIRRTVEPKVMGSQIGLKPLPTLIAMFIGLKLMGFLGFFIGPLVVILFTTAREANIIRVNFKI
ncbi:sporulation integral membrane protein YtvI [Sporosarcina ureilytica]|uniref:Sporulation integral membrane protein YtvI n=1 Tax=Sporosarcina ureilytica TaxID=298596 RepID=A0A1D8JI68_9BACL|nr:sporulation integral membrane protein YtvI [Sporosarcina ureilytica]AOV08374.1 sporulation integral membrane protein YtvI [Sporosarcina ureilytica]